MTTNSQMWAIVVLVLGIWAMVSYSSVLGPSAGSVEMVKTVAETCKAQNLTVVVNGDNIYCAPRPLK